MSKVITICGVGALGSHLAYMLRNVDEIMGEETEIRLVDEDKVEAKNRLSQFHYRVGYSKVKSLATALAYWNVLSIREFPIRLSKEAGNVAKVLGGSSLIIDCFDNKPSRELLQEYAITEKVPLLHCALAADGEFGMVRWTETFKADEGEGKATCEGGGHLPFICLVASTGAYAAQRFLKDGTKYNYMIPPGGSVTLF